MNIPPSLIILSVVLLFLTLFLVTGINESLPAFIKTEFDSISTRYFSNMIINGGLTTTDITSFKNELVSLGLTDINISIYLDGNTSIPASPGSKIEWGRKATLLVEAVYQYETVSPDGKGQRRTKQHKLRYENSSTILSLDND